MHRTATTAKARGFVDEILSDAPAEPPPPPGAAQADVCLLMVPADGNFTTAIQKGDHKAGRLGALADRHQRAELSFSHRAYSH